MKTHQKFQCKICGLEFKEVKRLNVHLKTHEIIKCKHCDFESNDRKTLLNHAKIHAYKKCEICGISVQNMDMHINTHDKENKYVLKCPRCPLKTDRKNVLKHHLQRHENNDAIAKKWPEKIWCEDCKKYLKDGKSFHYHQRYVHCESKFECDLCGRKSARKDFIRKHLKNHNQKQ
jgi:hypothetical protein